MTRRQLIQGVAAAAPALPGNAATPKPNVVIFLADDLGFRDVGYQGAEIDTPNIDALAEGGLRFERFHSFPLCSPTRAGLLTGRHPVRYGLTYSVVRPWSHYGLSTAETTMADVFRGAGYQTGAIGKWHLGHTHRKLLPQSRGFDYFYGHMNGAIDYFTHQRDGAMDFQRNGATVQDSGYSTDLLAADAARWIGRRCGHQWRFPTRPGRIGIGALVQQHSNHAFDSVRTRDRQCSDAIPVGFLGLGPIPQQPAHGGDVVPVHGL